MYYIKMNIQNEITKFWQGNLTLWKSYWLIGELFNRQILELVLMITIAAVITAFIPAIEAYKQALHTSLSANSFLTNTLVQ